MRFSEHSRGYQCTCNALCMLSYALGHSVDNSSMIDKVLCEGDSLYQTVISKLKTDGKFINQLLSLEGTSRQRSGKGAIRKRFPLQKPRWEKTKLTIRYLYHETIVSRMGSYFPNRWPLSYLNLTKNIYENIHKAPTAQKILNTKT